MPELIITGFDFGSDGWASEYDVRMNPDGSMTILDIRQWKTTIDHDPLSPSARPPHDIISVSDQ